MSQRRNHLEYKHGIQLPTGDAREAAAMAKDSKAVKRWTLNGQGHFFQLGSRNHRGAKELKSNGDGDMCSMYILYILNHRKEDEFPYQARRMEYLKYL